MKLGKRYFYDILSNNMQPKQPISIKFHHTETSASALTPMSILIPMKAWNPPTITYDKEHHKFDVLLTVHLSIILGTNQLNAKNLVL